MGGVTLARIYAALAKTVIRVGMISGRIDVQSELENILLFHRTRRKDAIASTNDGVVLWGYQGLGVHVCLDARVSMYQSQIREYSHKDSADARSGP